MQYWILKEIWNNHQWEKCSYNLFIIHIRKWIPYHEAIMKSTHWGKRYTKWRFDKFIEENKRIYWEPIISKPTLRERIYKLWRSVEDAFIRPLHTRQDTYYL